MKTMIKLTLLVVPTVALCSCGSQSRHEPIAVHQGSGTPNGVPPEPAEDPDPTMRVVAYNAPCFILSKTKTFKDTLNEIALVRKLTTNKDDEALVTLQSRGVFVPLTVGVHIKVSVGQSIYPYPYGPVASKRYIGTECTIDRSALVPRSDLPQADPPVSVAEQQLQVETSFQIIQATIDGRDTTKAMKIYEDEIERPFYKRHHLEKGWDQLKK